MRRLILLKRVTANPRGLIIRTVISSVFVEYKDVLAIEKDSYYTISQPRMRIRLKTDSIFGSVIYFVASCRIGHSDSLLELLRNRFSLCRPDAKRPRIECIRQAILVPKGKLLDLRGGFTGFNESPYRPSELVVTEAYFGWRRTSLLSCPLVFRATRRYDAIPLESIAKIVLIQGVPLLRRPRLVVAWWEDNALQKYCVFLHSALGLIRAFRLAGLEVDIVPSSESRLVMILRNEWQLPVFVGILGVVVIGGFVVGLHMLD